MKRTVILLTGFLLVTMGLHAQQKQSRFLANLSFGPSVPVGKFADKSYGDLNKQKLPGLAKTGIGVNLSVGYYLNRSLGVLLAAGYSEHKQDWSGYNAYLTSQPLIDAPPLTEIDGESWKTVNVMGGGFFVVPLTASHKLNMVTKLTAGVCKTAVPGYDYKAYLLDGQLIWKGTQEKTDLSWSFCYQASVGLQYKLSDRLHALLDINSFNAIPQKEIDGVTKKYNLNTVNAMAGIGINF